MVTWLAHSSVDELTGRLVAELDQLGLREDTIIVIWGDHGFHLGDHGLWGKHTPFEEAVRAPLMIIDPRSGGQPQRVVSPVDFIDIFPTLCDLAALPKPGQLQGVTLAQILPIELHRAKIQFVHLPWQKAHSATASVPNASMSGLNRRAPSSSPEPLRFQTRTRTAAKTSPMIPPARPSSGTFLACCTRTPDWPDTPNSTSLHQ